MPDIEFSIHAKEMLVERNIPETWVWRTINTPDKKRLGNDGNMHYRKPIRERQGRVLHVVVDHNRQPNRIVTVFFDRRPGSKKPGRK
jgi:hypothetical protein